jgi:outer membrane protein assembly factor BamB
MGLLLALALSAAPTPQVDLPKDLASLGRRVNSLLPRATTPGAQVATIAPTPTTAVLPRRVAPHEYVSNIYVRGSKTFYALDSATGAIRWTHPTQQNKTVNFAQLAGVGAAVEDYGGIMLLSGKSGTPLWRYMPAGGAVANIVGAYNDTIYAVETRTIMFTQPSALPDALVALNDADGSVRWRYTLQHSHFGEINLLGSQGDPLVYFNDDVSDTRPTAGSVSAINSDTGALAWRRVVSGTPALVPYYAATGVVIAYAPVSLGQDNNGALLRMDIQTGMVAWTLRINQRDAIAYTPTTLYLGNLRQLTAYNIADLSIRWKVTVLGNHAAPLLMGDHYIGARTSASFAVYDAASGARLWTLDHPATFGVIRLVGTTLCANALAEPGSLAGFDVTSGKQLWRYQATDTLRPVMVFDAAAIYVRTYARVLSFSAQSGVMRWQSAVNEPLDLQMDVALT